jgi:outer membrane protein
VKTLFRVAFLMIFGLAVMPRPGAAGEWGIGSAIAHFQPSQTGVRSESIAAPYVTYHSERLNIDLATVSYTLLKSAEFLISMEGELRFDGYDPKDSPALTGMEKRKSSFDAGVGVARAGEWGVMKIMVLGDITGTHKGYEARAQYEVPYMVNRLLIAPAVGVSWLDDALVDYYYGVRLDEATSTRSQYTGASTTNAYVHLSLGYILSDRMELLAGLKYVRLGENIEASPIVDKAYETSAFSAVQYKF